MKIHRPDGWYIHHWAAYVADGAWKPIYRWTRQNYEIERRNDVNRRGLGRGMMSAWEHPDGDVYARGWRDALDCLGFNLTEDNFPFFNRYPHVTTDGTIAMWAESDVLAMIASVKRLAENDVNRRGIPFTPGEES